MSDDSVLPLKKVFDVIRTVRVHKKQGLGRHRKENGSARGREWEIGPAHLCVANRRNYSHMGQLFYSNGIAP